MERNGDTFKEGSNHKGSSVRFHGRVLRLEGLGPEVEG